MKKDYIENSMWSEEKVIDYLKSNLKPKRLKHVFGVVDSIDALAVKYGIDREKARFSALYHDILKENSANNLIDYIRENGEDPGELLHASKVLHSQAGAIFARVEGGVIDEDILNAIRYHTTGREEMSTLEKMLYLADVIEAGRDYEGVDRLRDLSMKDLDLAMLHALNSSLRFLEERNEYILIASVRARNYYLALTRQRLI